MRFQLHIVLLSTCLGLSAVSAQAAKQKYYDDFSGTTLDDNRWDDGETWRQIDAKGRLIMGRYSFGGTTSDTGTVLDSFSLHQHKAAPVTTLGASITVNDVQVGETCAANTSPSTARARVIGWYFNTRVGGPVAGDRTGDVFAQVRVGRASNSTDASGVLRIQGVVGTCSNSDCSSSSLIGTVQDLGTAALNQTVVAQVVWDKANKRFLLSHDGQAPAAVAYTDSDSTPPEEAINMVGLINNTANCSAARVRAGLSATFDNVVIKP